MFETKISVFFITLNEASTIRAAIEAVQALDEIIVVDSGSTDGTVEIARELGAKVVHQDWLGFAKQKAYALSLCRHQWCFNLDGDEVISQEALTEIRTLIEVRDIDAIRVPFEDVFMGRSMHRKSKKRSIVRVFKKHSVCYPEDRLVHENVMVAGTEVKTKVNIDHYGYASVEQFMAKQNTYSSLGAQQKFMRNKKASVAKLLFVFPVMLFKAYFLRKLYLSGVRGLIQAHVEAMYAFLKEAKLYEYHFTSERLDADKSLVVEPTERTASANQN